MSEPAYSQRITRRNPGCIIFLLDHSYSMIEGLAGSKRPKREALATALNRIISDILQSCERGEEKPFNYFDIGVIGYTTDQSGNPVIGPALQGMLAGKDLVTIEELFDNPLRIEKRKKKQQEEDGVGGLRDVEVEVDFPIWYEAPDDGAMAGTPMSGALSYCYRVASSWCEGHADCFPPIVIHLTDGESTDGSPEQAAEALRSVSTGDGDLLLFTCHLSKSEAPSVMFPTSEYELPDEYSRMLFRMTSPVPDKLVEMSDEKKLEVPSGSRGMVFNADGTKMIKLLNIGTVIATGQPRAAHLV